ARRAPLPGGLVEEPGVIYAAAAPRAVGAADVRPRVPRQVLQQGLAGMRYQPGREAQEPFRQAKARVVDGFESDYIRLALSRHQGNVARAARASSKHRRAFWALMRKHGIDAGPYRRQAEQARD
ncbi:helix-turn-helix domain-containing protein, partial [Achromobacter xylosoxidans]|uniref:helix-turn-helix domain-containing protein n=6 Tax=Alcaligenaceae TaxID=506 RepID=UPI0024027EBE